ncbi:hypothetical protein A2U01_0002319 [Trifolium medium]|uniref:Retrotransposon gag domain-containing protein n=1 Tax=Trifolium medium TaxID=97028 RepID=A0A392M2K1_9FABA|nr:hypothetical protein [Trifolium medium]
MSVPVNNIFSSIHASWSPNHDHQTPSQNPPPRNTIGNQHMPNPPRRNPAKPANKPQIVNNHVQNSLHNVLQDEVSSQLHRADQQNPLGADIINTSGNNGHNHDDNRNDDGGHNRNRRNEGVGGGNGGRGGGRGSPHPRSSDHGSSRDHPSEDGRRRGNARHLGCTPFTMRILESRIPRPLEKPPKLEIYDGTTDPDEHLEHIDTILDYYQAQGPVKWKLFVLTLKGSAMTWFKGLEDDSIN